MVVDARTVIRWPYFKNRHASRSKSLMRQKLQSDISSPLIINFFENLLSFLVRHTSFVTTVWLKLCVQLFVFHLIQMVHDSNGNAFTSVSIRCDHRVMECELQALPVQILIFFFIGNGLFVEIWQVADVEILQAIIKMLKWCLNGFEVGQVRLKQGGLFFNDWIEYPREIEDLKCDIIIDFASSFALLTLTDVELYKEILDLSEWFNLFYLHLFVIAIISRKRELFRLIFPTLMSSFLTLEHMHEQWLLSLVFDHISCIYIQGPIEPIEFDPYLLLKNFRCSLRSREKLLIDHYWIRYRCNIGSILSGGRVFMSDISIGDD